MVTVSAIASAVGQFFHAIGAGFEWASARMKANNTPAMQARAMSAEDQATIDAAAHALATHDLPALRKISS